MTTTPVGLGEVAITADQLRALVAAGHDVVLLEIWRQPPRDEVLVAGAQPVALTSDLAGTPSVTAGNLPLPSDAQIQDVVRRWGIHATSTVVAYSVENPALAARAWWTLKWAGVPDVRVLEGDPPRAPGGVARQDSRPPGTFTVRTGSLPTLDADTASALARTGVLVDARAASGYTDGHIPGAVSLPAGALAADDQLRAQFEALGVDVSTPVGAYCGGGTSATLTVFSLAKLGISAVLYPGSFSAYSADPDRPVATGSDGAQQ